VSVSCGRSVVRMDETPKPVAALDLAQCCRARSLGSRTWRPESELAVRPLAVVVVGVDAEDMLEMAAVEDQPPGNTYDETLARVEHTATCSSPRCEAARRSPRHCASCAGERPR
jgi:hypothetical protein